MANYERGVYEPSDEDARVFDGSEDEDDVEGSRLPLLIVLALLVLAMFGGRGLARLYPGRGAGPRRNPGADRCQRSRAGGAAADGRRQTVPYQGFKIYEQPAPPDDDADAAPAAAPAAAAPKPAAPPVAGGSARTQARAGSGCSAAGADTDRDRAGQDAGRKACRRKPAACQSGTGCAAQVHGGH